MTPPSINDGPCTVGEAFDDDADQYPDTQALSQAVKGLELALDHLVETGRAHRHSVDGDITATPVEGGTS
jgi:hypothetical protein